MNQFKQLIQECGIKNEYIIKHSKINRTKFYMGLNHPTLFNEIEIKKIASLIRISEEELIGVWKKSLTQDVVV